MNPSPAEHLAGDFAAEAAAGAGSAEPGQAAANDYDSFAETYSAVNEVSLLNAYYERPATLALAGDVAGRRILGAGCGSGLLSAALRDRGAVVTGFDGTTTPTRGGPARCSPSTWTRTHGARAPGAS